MEIITSRFGALESVDVDDDVLVCFPEGIPGFEDHRQFALLSDTRYEPFHWLQSCTNASVCFVVLSPHQVVEDYALPDADTFDGAVQLLCLVVIPAGNTTEMTVNLKAPVMIDGARRARQVIRSDDRYSLRHPLLRRPASLAAVGS